MKERILNLFMFLVSLAFMASGVILMFFKTIPLLDIVNSGIDKYFNNKAVTDLFISFMGSFIFGWGIFFFLLTVFIVMELKNTSIYPFIFWGFTFWTISSEAVGFINKFYFLMICFGIIYSLIFIPFFISLGFKSKA